MLVSSDYGDVVGLQMIQLFINRPKTNGQECQQLQVMSFTIRNSKLYI